MIPPALPFDNELEHLFETFPLSQRWKPPEPFFDLADVRGLEIPVAGLLARSSDGREATGSAGAERGSIVKRAYVELLERTTLIDHVALPSAHYQVLDRDGRLLACCPAIDVFPDDQNEQRHSISNGVAAHQEFSAACDAAYLELVERDRLLRSWFGGKAPRRIRSTLQTEPALRSVGYQVKVYAFPDCDSQDESEVSVVGVFCFPEDASAPLVFGTAASFNVETAVHRAERECLQRLGFLWNETIPDTEPAFEPSAAYHQEFYLFPQSHAALYAWLDGERQDPSCAPTFVRRPGNLRFVDLTPEHLRSRFWVLKALADGFLPLTFGREHPQAHPRFRGSVHPIA